MSNVTDNTMRLFECEMGVVVVVVAGVFSLAHVKQLLSNVIAVNL